jgi:hypothetical protein
LRGDAWHQLNATLCGGEVTQQGPTANDQPAIAFIGFVSYDRKLFLSITKTI